MSLVSIFAKVSSISSVYRYLNINTDNGKLHIMNVSVIVKPRHIVFTDFATSSSMLSADASPFPKVLCESLLPPSMLWESLFPSVRWESRVPEMLCEDVRLRVEESRSAVFLLTAILMMCM